MLGGNIAHQYFLIVCIDDHFSKLPYAEIYTIGMMKKDPVTDIEIKQFTYIQELMYGKIVFRSSIEFFFRQQAMFPVVHRNTRYFKPVKSGTIYSVLILFTGLALAALMVCAPRVSRVNPSMSRKPAGNTHQ